jgi:hypothetical protein
MNNQHRFRFLSFLIILGVLISSVGMPDRKVRAAATITFTGGELLGKPEDTNVTINIVPATTIEYHYQYGTVSGTYTDQTANVTATGGQPHEVVISGLTPNTRYYYRMQYHAPGDAMDDWVNRTEHSFWTQRSTGSSFSFSVTSDSHASFNTAHQNAMTNINTEHPDFNIDLGDTFYPDGTTSQTAVNTKYLAYRDPLYLGAIGPSVPIFLASGNHEDEEGWNLDDTPFSIAVGSTISRKLYFPTPIQDGFYTGNTDILAAINGTTYGDQYREDYYAWTWGDALFVVIDEFQYTMNLPYASGAAGEGTDDTQTGDQWNWTLGAQQFQWFKQTIENSNAKYKFVFSHQMLGGIPNLTVAGVGPGYVRGGAGAAAYFEWGGKNGDGTDGFAAHRNPADFGSTPIHQLMVANGVSAYFHGHDHQYVYETMDDIVYQEVPSPSMSGSGFSGIYTEGSHTTFTTVKMLPSPGHLLVSVNPTQATVDYVSSSTTSGTVNYSYTIAPHSGGVTHVLTTAVNDPAGGTVSPLPGDHTYNEGNVVTISATPNPGYFFSGWSGDVSTVADTGAATTTITMNGDYSITGNFADLSTITPTPSRTPTATLTRTNTVTATASRTPTSTRTSTMTFTPSFTRTSTITPSPSSTRTSTSTPTGTRTATSTQTNTPSVTLSSTATSTRTLTVSFTPSSSPTRTYTPTTTSTRTPTASPSSTPTRTVTPTGTSTPALSYSIPLVVGWNLVSFNVHPASSAPVDVLASIDGMYDLVYAWNAASSSWMRYDPIVPYGATLTYLDEKMGFWIDMNTAGTLTVGGSAPGTSNISLSSGWNLVGFPASAGLTLPDALSLHGVGTDFSLVYAYHAGESDLWKLYSRTGPVFNNDLTALAPGWGYWVNVGAAHTWDVSY